MKLVEFTYTKPNGSVSQRALLELKSPQTNTEGLDVSELPPEDFAELSNRYQQLINEHEAKIVDLLQEYDLVKNYRAFVPSRMTDVTTTWL